MSLLTKTTAHSKQHRPIIIMLVVTMIGLSFMTTSKTTTFVHSFLQQPQPILPSSEFIINKSIRVLAVTDAAASASSSSSSSMDINLASLSKPNKIVNSSQKHPNINNSNGKKSIENDQVMKQKRHTGTTTTTTTTQTTQTTTGRHRRRRKATPPSQDINFLLKRTQYLLDLTPSDILDLSSSSSSSSENNNHEKGEEENEEVASKNRKIKIHRHTFHWLIDAWANSYHPKATFYAHSLLDQMKKLSLNNNDNNNNNSISNSNNNNDNSNDLYNSDTKMITPNVRSYTKVMNAYSKEGKENSGDKAFQLLQEMLLTFDDDHNTSSSSSSSSNRSNSSQISSKISRSSSNSSNKEEEEESHKYLKPDILTYASVLEAYANSGTSESAFRAEELCMDMVQNMIDDSQNIKIEINDHHSTTSTSKNLTNQQQQQQQHLQPTTRCYNAVIQAYSNSGMYDRAQRAESFIKQIETLYQKHKMNGSSIIIQTNTVNYNTILTAYAQSGLPDAAEQTERILREMKHPNVISYNACIDAWAKSGNIESGNKAFALLQEMNQLYESKRNINVKPNTRSYNSVMNAYAKSSSKDGPQEAERILDMMEALFESGNEDVKPDFFSFATVINAWGRSYQFGKAQRVLNIFNHMVDLYEKGNESLRPNGKKRNFFMSTILFVFVFTHYY